jgi:hypothetical protein
MKLSTSKRPIDNSLCYFSLLIRSLQRIAQRLPATGDPSAETSCGPVIISLGNDV